LILLYSFQQFLKINYFLQFPLAARKKDKWEKYQVTDSLGTRVILKDKSGKSLGDFIVGKFSYKQPPANQPNYGGQNNISGYSYVRSSGKPETFATDGFLSMIFNRDFNSFRDKTLLKLNPEYVKGVNIETPNETVRLTSIDNVWIIGSENADSTKVANYFSSLQSLNGTKMDDTYVIEGSPTHTCNIIGDNMSNILIEAYETNGIYKIKSSLNPDMIFESSAEGDDYSKIFKSKSDLLMDQ